MSRARITEGDPLASLLQPVSRQAPIESGAADNRVAGGGLVMGRGLGFLPTGLVDQHFDTRRRLGRLARALFELPQAERFGFGIDEDTALRVDLGSARAGVVGASTVTLLDARNASRAPGRRFGADGLRLAVASPGDGIDLATLAVSPAPGAAAALHDPDEEQPRVHQLSGGMAVPEPTVGTLLADSLFGPNPLERLERPSVRADAGVLYRFTRLPGAASWEANGSRSVSGIGFALHPVLVSFAAAGLQ
jgi:cyanophycinase